MADVTIPASEVSENLPELLDQLDQRRILVTQRREERAFLISVRELRALEETLTILESQELMASLRDALEEVRQGRVRPARAAFDQLDAELGGGE